MKNHRVCVIGYGGMGNGHAGFCQNSDVVELAGIHDIKEERCLVAQERGIKAYRTLESVLEDKSIDIVVIATPNDVHEELAIKCMDAGKNVISEKPVTLSCESLERMIEASKRNGVIFSVHQNRRWDPDFIAVKQLIEDNLIDRVFEIESRVHGSRGIPGDWRGRKENGGGMLFDWGVHLIDQLLTVYRNERIKKVYCEFDHITNEEVDDGFKLTLWVENGPRILIEVSTYNFINLPRFYVRGIGGTAVIKDWGEPCEYVSCKKWNEKNVIPIKTGAGLTKTMAPRDEITTESFSFPLPETDVHDYYRNFCAAIEGRETQTVTHDEMRRVLRLIEAAFESVRTGAPVDFE